MRLIEANALIKKWCDIECRPKPHCKEDCLFYDAIMHEPTVDAIPVSWIEERIENAINAKQTLIAQMWLELIDGYMREKKNDILL